MLNVRKSAAAIFTIAALAGTQVSAAEHEIIILNGAFFPYQTTAAAGDTIVFKNRSGSYMDVYGNGWEIYELAPGYKKKLTVSSGTSTEFESSTRKHGTFRGKIVSK